jgi:sensor histidine kinase YesM
VIRAQVSIPTILTEHRKRINERTTLGILSSPENPAAIVAAVTIIGAALGGLTPAALPMFLSLLGVSALTLLFASARTLMQRLQHVQSGERKPHSYHSTLAAAAIYFVIASTISVLVYFAIQRFSFSGDIARLGIFPFVLTHVLFVSAFIIVPRVVRDFYAIRADHDARRSAERLRVANLERSLAMSELKTLQAQIEPHFLYNVLANVQSMIAHAPTTADAMLTHLIDYLKHALPSMRGGESTLRAELDLVRSYLAIAQLRFGDRLSVAVNDTMAEHAAAFAMPPMLLLPLVENAIKHGVEAKPGAVHVKIDMKISDEMLTISVIDDGAGFKQTSGNGIGIANVRDRLAVLYQDRAAVSVVPREGGGVISTLSIPVIEKSVA